VSADIKESLRKKSSANPIVVDTLEKAISYNIIDDLV
jgi:hypothetical protein